MPNDRSTKHPAKGFCRNPACQEKGQREELFTFPIEHADVECPKCGATMSPIVGVYVLSHLLLPIKGGPLRGAGGLSYALACDSQRAYLATVSNLEAASGDVNVINCPLCLENARKLGIKMRSGWKPDPQTNLTGV
jgi:hypothetical protein